MYYDADADLGLIGGKTVAVIGFGSQGHAHAQNLRDSGVNVVVSDVPGTANAARAQKAGFDVLSAAEAAKRGDLIIMLVPDEVQARLYRSDVAAELKAGKVLMFAHGFNIHFSQIVPPKDVDVIMVAPKGPGHLVRRQYEEGKGVPALIAVYQDATGKAKDLALAYAKGIGATRAGVIETTFSEETETDLFGEQAVLCGGVTELIMAGFDTLTEAGYQPEVAYFECLHELKLIVDLIYEGGFARMHRFVSETAKYGDLTRGPRIVDDHVRASMKKVLDEVRSGQFAREWIAETQTGKVNYNALLQKDLDHPIESVGKKLRERMSWLGNK